MNVDLENKKEELNPTRFIKLSEMLDDREKTLEELTQKAEEMQVQLWEDEKEIANLNMKIEDCYNAQIKINDEMGKTKKPTFAAGFFFGVVPTGIEPVTRGFSVLCSTN